MRLKLARALVDGHRPLWGKGCEWEGEDDARKETYPAGSFRIHRREEVVLWVPAILTLELDTLVHERPESGVGTDFARSLGVEFVGLPCGTKGVSTWATSPYRQSCALTLRSITTICLAEAKGDLSELPAVTLAK